MWFERDLAAVLRKPSLPARITRLGELAPEIESVYLMASLEHLYVSGHRIREVASLGYDVGELVPDHVERALELDPNEPEAKRIKGSIKMGGQEMMTVTTEVSGDGKTLLFTSEVFPECKDEACNSDRLEAEKQKVAEGFRKFDGEWIGPDEFARRQGKVYFPERP